MRTERARPGKIGLRPNQYSPDSDQYCDSHHTSDSPPQRRIDATAARLGNRRRPMKADRTGISKAGVPIDPKTYQISTTDLKNSAKPIASIMVRIKPIRVKDVI